jgi:hypothetical protein
MRRIMASLIGLGILAVLAGEASGEPENGGHYCKEEMRMVDGSLRGQHAFGYMGQGSGLPYTCGPNGCHQIPDWKDGACSTHGHEPLP